MTKDEKSQGHAIIHAASAAAAAIGGGLAQLPGSDTVPITAIQVGMVISLGAVFGQEITKTTATSIVGGLASSIGGRTLSQLLVGWIPGFGNAINATTAAGITETLGWMVAKQFANSGTEDEEGGSDR
ncbi:MAG: hypothetical protein II954_10045 [Synergistaceae bacterium]|nr:hypothetical protein [Synergistaceae bacterium]